MSDFFALLGVPRSPWLDPETLQARFHAASGELHPDRVHHLSSVEREAAGARFAEINQAYQCLRDTKQRLGHLLELELGSRPAEMRDIPPVLSDIFFALGPVLRQVDAFLQEREKVESPLLRVQWFERGMEWDEQLRQWQEKVRGLETGLNGELQKLGADWPAGTTASLPRLGEIYRALSLLQRWQGQIQERLAKLVW